MKKIFYIPLCIMLASFNISHTSIMGTTSWTKAPILGAIAGVCYAYVNDWQEHPDTDRIRTIYQSEEDLQELKKAHGTWQKIKAYFKYQHYKQNLATAVHELELAQPQEKRQIHHHHDKNLLWQVYFRAKQEELTLNKDNLLVYSITGAAAGLALAIITDFIKNY